MVSVFCMSSLFPRWWNSSKRPFVLKPSTIALSIPLVVHKIFHHVPCKDLRQLCLVNRTWNHEAAGHLQKRGRQVTLHVLHKYNHRTREFIELLESAIILEEKENISWRWPFGHVCLDNVPYQRPTFADVEFVLRKISLRLTDLKIAEGLQLQDASTESTDLSFPCLNHLTCYGSGDLLLVQWIIKNSPQLYHLKIDNDRSLDVPWAKSNDHYLEKYFSGKFIATSQDLDIFVSFLAKLKYSLRTLSIDITLDKSADFRDSLSLATDFVNLTVLKIHTYLAEALFRSPDRLPGVKYLELVLDEPDPQIWLQQWNGKPVLSVEILSLRKYPVEGSMECVPSRVVHETAGIFPNTKILRLQLPLLDYAESVALDRWVPALEHLEELCVEVCFLWQLRAVIPNPLSSFAGLRVLKLVYSNGNMSDAHCQSVFMKMSNLKRLRLISESDKGEEVSATTLEEMQKNFVVTWENHTTYSLTRNVFV